jgi:serine/threonine protein kinase
MIGETVSHYKILEKLGEGGMGVVYKAQDLRLERVVALKFLPHSSAPEGIARFEQEAKAISILNHSAIATIHDIDEADGRRFLVMEYLPGGTLKSRIKQYAADQRQLPIAEVIACGIQMAEGLASAHRAGIIHRDVKSDNAMLNPEGHVKLTDFGLAKLQNAGEITKVGSTVGTAAYMSPEQVRGEDVDSRSDLFSLGVVLYELTTTRLPFRGDHDAALAYSIVNEEPLAAQSLRPDTPEILWTIISRCLEKNPSRRYQSAEEVAGDLRKMDLNSGETLKPGVPERRSWRRLSIASAVLLVGLVVAYFAINPSPPPESGKKSIAVLPFVNMSSDPDQEYFSDGLTEELLNVLAKNPGLRVTSRTSSFSFKGTNTDLKTIAAKLQVQHILEGSVRRSGNALRITAQLIEVETDAHLWSETYDGTMDNVFARPGYHLAGGRGSAQDCSDDRPADDTTKAN